MRSARNIAFTAATMVVPLAVSIVTVPFYLDLIGVERYGALAIAWLLLGYVAQADFGIGRAVTQRLAAMPPGERRGEAAARVLWSAILLSVLIGIAGGIVLYIAANWFFAEAFDIEGGLRGELLSATLLLAVSAPLVNLYSTATGALLGAERVRSVAVLNLFTALTLQLFPLLAAYGIGVEMPLLIAAALAARALMTLPAGALAWSTFLRGQHLSGRVADMRRLANFGIWIMVSSIVGPLMLVSDRFLIGALAGAAAVAAYTIPFQVAYRTLVFPAAVMQVLFPQLSAGETGAARAKAGQAMVSMGGVFAPVVIGLVCLADPLLQLWLGDQLDPRSILIGQIVLLGLWTNALAQVPFGLVQARGNPRFTALLHITELPIYAGLLWWLGTHYGLAGMASAFALRCAADGIALAAKARLLTPSIIAGLAFPAAAIVAAFAISQLDWNPASRLAIAAALAAASLAAAWAGAPEELRQRAAAILRR